MPILSDFSGKRGKRKYQLVEYILRLSGADNWDEARREWMLEHVTHDLFGYCLCGHPISNRYLVRNQVNSCTTVLGSCCVKKLLGQDADHIYVGLNRITANPNAELNIAAVEFVHSKGWISDKERGFYLDTLRPKVRCRGLSYKQQAWREAINTKVLNRMAAAGKGVDHV